MNGTNQEHEKTGKSMHTLAMVNVAIWTIAIVAMVIIMERGTTVRGMFPILAGGVAVGVSLNSAIQKFRRST